MIAAAAHYRLEAGLKGALDMDVRPMWPLNDATYAEAAS
jgi:hypothetical protein